MIDKSAFVHPTAIVEEGASIGANAHIGPFCIVGPHVEIGEGTVLKSHVVGQPVRRFRAGRGFHLLNVMPLSNALPHCWKAIKPN